MHLYKNKTKFDNWKFFENCLLANKCYLFKFDLKDSYHHIDVFDSHQTYLSFFWDINRAIKYFVFTVLPFGLSSAPFVFTEVPLSEKNSVCKCSNFDKTTFINSSSVPNVIKSIWIPCQCLIWLGTEIDINNNILLTTSSRIRSILDKTEFLTNKRYIFARELSELAGKIITAQFIIGNMTRL